MFYYITEENDGDFFHGIVVQCDRCKKWSAIQEGAAPSGIAQTGNWKVEKKGDSYESICHVCRGEERGSVPTVINAVPPYKAEVAVEDWEPSSVGELEKIKKFAELHI